MAGNLGTGGAQTYIYDNTAPNTTTTGNSTRTNTGQTIILNPVDT